MRYELLKEENGIKIFARIDDDGLIRVTCLEEDPYYQAWLNPADVANLHLAETPATIESTQPDEADLTEGQN
jgi:hypothetical protein